MQNTWREDVSEKGEVKCSSETLLLSLPLRVVGRVKPNMCLGLLKFIKERRGFVTIKCKIVVDIEVFRWC